MNKKLPNLRRQDVINTIYEKTGLSLEGSAGIFNEIISLMESSLVKDEKVKIPAFGTFFTRYKKQRIGRNPKTKEEAIITARRILAFRASMILKNKINV